MTHFLRRTILFTALLFACFISHAQLLTNVDFVHHGPGDNSEVRIVRTDAAGNSVTLVEFEGTIYIGTDSFVSQSSIRSDFVIVKRDYNENYLWARLFTCSGTFSCSTLDVDASGNVYFVGGYYGLYLLQIDSGSGGFYTAPTNMIGNHAFIGKYSAGGVLQWMGIIEGQYNTSNQPHIGFNQLRVNGNSIFLTGIAQGNVDYDPSPAPYIFPATLTAVICSYTLNGELNWAYTMGNYGGWLEYIGFTSTNEIVLAGTIFSSADLAPGPQWQQYNISSQDFFVVKLSAAGLLQWARVHANPGAQRVTGLTMIGDNSFVLTGKTDANVDLDPSPGTFIVNCPFPSGTRYFIGRYDMVAGDFVSGAELTVPMWPSQLYWTGAKFVVYGSDWDGKYSLAFFDTGYNLISYNEYGGQSPGIYAQRTHFRYPYTLYVCGHASGNNNYGNNGGSQDVYAVTDTLTGIAVKYYLGWGPESVSEVQSENDLKVYPNPANESAEVLLPDGKSSLYVYTIDGMLVLAETNITSVRFVLNTSTFTPGIYLLKCDGSEGTTTMTRLVVTH